MCEYHCTRGGVEWNEKWPDREVLVDFFMEPPKTDDYLLEWNDPDDDGVVDFLVRKHDFSEERVDKVLASLRAEKKKGRQEHLTQWF